MAGFRDLRRRFKRSFKNDKKKFNISKKMFVNMQGIYAFTSSVTDAHYGSECGWDYRFRRGGRGFRRFKRFLWKTLDKTG
jgi:hypothetical protein